MMSGERVKMRQDWNAFQRVFYSFSNVRYDDATGWGDKATVGFGGESEEPFF